MDEIYVKGYLGFGDNIYQRPFIKQLTRQYDRVWLETPVPYMYIGCSMGKIHFVRPPLIENLRTQGREVQTVIQPAVWSEKPDISTMDTLELMYHRQNPQGKCHRNGDSIIACFDAQVPGADFPIDFKMDVPDLWTDTCIDALNRWGICEHIGVIRVPTVRAEWEVANRNCKNEYISHVLEKYGDEYTWISVCDLQEGEEWIPGTNGDEWNQDASEMMEIIERKCVINFHCGELDFRQMIALYDMADIVVSPVGYAAPLCAALDTKCLLLWGGFMRSDTVLDERMGLENMTWVTPDEECHCLDPHHECNRTLDTAQINSAFDTLVSGKVFRQSRKKNVLCVRMTAELAGELSRNPYIQQECNLVAVDAHISKYAEYKDDFINIKRIPQTEADISDILTHENIHVAIISQKYYPDSDRIADMCYEKGIDVIWTERFFDGKMIFDRKGLQYCPQREIDTFWEEAAGLWPEMPIHTRQPQEDLLTREEVLKKYNLDKNDNHIIIMGQTVFDMSLKQSRCRRVETWQEYIEMLLDKNPDTQFLIKHHPQYYGPHASRREQDIGWIDEIERIIEIRENIHTLFRAFRHFTSFSSTTIMEGLPYGCKFATCGYHFCDDPDIVLQLKTREIFSGLHDRLKDFRIDKEKLHTHLAFITQMYTLPLRSRYIEKKIHMEPDEFYTYMRENVR